MATKWQEQFLDKVYGNKVAGTVFAQSLWQQSGRNSFWTKSMATKWQEQFMDKVYGNKVAGTVFGQSLWQQSVEKLVLPLCCHRLSRKTVPATLLP